MAYKKQNFVNGETLTAEHLNHIEDGIVELEKQSGGNVDLTGYATEEFVTNKIAEAELGGEEVDLSGYAQKSELPTKVSQLQNDSGFITDYNETDPNVPAWAKNPTKPSYSKSEVGLGNVDNVKQYSASNPPPYPVTSVNGKTGAVTLDAVAVGARPSSWMPSASDVGALPSSTVIPTVPTKVSAFTNDAGYLTEHQDISGKLDADKLSEAIDEALAQAKDSGEFDGEDATTEIVTTAGTGSAYTATVNSIKALTAGVNFIMIPHVVSASTAPTLNVNGLGAKTIRQPLTTNTTATAPGTSNTWLVANKPVRVMYDGTYWKTVEIPRPSATGIYGTVPVESGGTGGTTQETACSGLGAVAYIAQTLTDAQKKQARENIGALGTAQVRVSEITLSAASWVQRSTNLYAQEVSISGVTAYSQVDITPSVEQLVVFYEKDLAFVTENENGTVTVYAIGQKPSNDYTMQVTITEVNV